MHRTDQQSSAFDLRSQENWAWAIPIALAVLLIITSSYNFLLFHSLAELFAIGVAILLSVVAWQMYPFTRNNYLMYLGCGYFWIGALDLMHTFTYKGMGIFPNDSGALSIEFWVGTRYLEAFLLLTAPWYLSRPLPRRVIFIGFGLLSLALFLAVMWGVFPQSYIDGQGLTTFKIMSEYAIVAILLLAIVVLWQKRDLLEVGVMRYMIASIVLTVFAELSFTLYVDVYGVALVVGHIFKLFSYWLIFVAMIRITLQEPFKVMARGASTYDAVPDAAIVEDAEGFIREVNKAACELVGLAEKDLLGLESHGVFHPRGKSKQDCEVCRRAVRGEAIRGLELPDGERWLDYSISPITDSVMVQGAVLAVRDISARKKAESELKKYQEHLEELVQERTTLLEASNKELEAFSYSVSHDLRAPLRGIDGFSLALLEDYYDLLDDTGKDYIRRVRDASQRMGVLIDDLLQLSRVSRMEIKKELVDLSALAGEIVEQLHDSDPERLVSVEIQEGLQVEGDQQLMRIALSNLLGNAWKYTRNEYRPRIAFGSEEQNGRRVFYVKDNGMGFDMAYANKLFQVFQRLHGAEIEGTGVGLATVQRIIHRLGGEVWGHSEQGQGAVFYFSL